MRGLGNLRLAETLQGYAAFLGRTTRRAAADRVRDDTSGCNAGVVSKVHGTLAVPDASGSAGRRPAIPAVLAWMTKIAGHRCCVPVTTERASQPGRISELCVAMLGVTAEACRWSPPPARPTTTCNLLASRSPWCAETSHRPSCKRRQPHRVGVEDI